MAINKIEEAKKLTEKGLYNEAYYLLKDDITKAAHAARDYHDLWNTYEEMSGAVEKAIKIYNNQIDYIGFYDDRLEAEGNAETEALKKSLIALQSKARASGILYYMFNELVGVYNEAIGE